MKTLITLLLALVFPLSMMAKPADENGKAIFEIDTDNSSMSIEGGKTFGSWGAEVKLIEGEFRVDVEALQNGGSGNEIFELTTFSVPVERIDSGKSRKNRDIYSNLKKDDYPDITFTLNSAEVNGSNGNEYEVLVNGVINAAGIDHEISFTSKVSVNDDGDLNISGATSLKFSDFDIDRPSAMLGTIRADDEFEIEYNLVLKNR